MTDEVQNALIEHANPAIAVKLSPVLPRDRLTVVEKVYHQQVGEQPIQIERSFERKLATQDSAYTGKPRRLVSSNWEPIDIGWLSQGAGSFYLTNEEGKGLQRKPTPEEEAAIADRVIEVCFTDSDGVPTGTDADGKPTGMSFLVPPGEAFRGTPSDVSRLRIRCRSEQAKYSIWVFPR